MIEKEPISLKKLMSHPEVLKATSNVNQELLERREYNPPICDVFKSRYNYLETLEEYCFELDRETKKQLPDLINNKVQGVRSADSPDTSLQKAYDKKRRIGVVFSGGPAPGGHNVIAGIYDAAKKANPDNKIFGFILGPDGIIENEAKELTQELVDRYRNLGGFSMIKTGRTKIDTPEKMALSKQTCKDLNLDALVIVGGDDSNTNAAFLAQEMKKDGVQVIGVPKTIDGDIQVRDSKGKVLCAMSFGFHTAARSFAKEISNLCNDCSSDVKYWHIC
ncbi:MAG: phosphofructokinase, partial [Desulfobacterium sp.]|nr:phosphofructokinase [Desulfobacterium sp.]